MRILVCALAGTLALGCLGSGTARADGIEDFYKGKTITIYSGFNGGEGAYNAYGRFLSRFMGAHIPGNPTIIMTNMPGAGSRTAGGYVSNVAAQDGLHIALVDQAVPFQQVVGEKMQFDTQKVFWIGNMTQSPNVLKSWTDSGFTTIESLKTKEAILGGSGSGSSQQAKLMNVVLGTKIKIINGYPSNEIDLALQRGEIQIRTASWAATKVTNQEWMRDKKITILVQFGTKGSPELPGVPLLMDLASNPDDHALLQLGSVVATLGKPLFVGPGVPADRVAALRAAFMKSLTAPDAVEEAKRINMELSPMTGEELQSIIAEMNKTPPALREKLAGLLGTVME
jgi:tripartite-type tricarboxylate transporter receptor subunit TctC